MSNEEWLQPSSVKNALTEQFFTDLWPDQDGAHTLAADLVGGYLNRGGWNTSHDLDLNIAV